MNLKKKKNGCLPSIVSNFNLNITLLAGHCCWLLKHIRQVTYLERDVKGQVSYDKDETRNMKCKGMYVINYRHICLIRSIVLNRIKKDEDVVCF